MKKYSLIIILFASLLFHFGCLNCRLVECSPNGGFVQLRLMKDGQNALFGPGAIVNIDSVEFYISEGFKYNFPIFYFDSTQSIGMYLDNGARYILELPGIQSDTLIANTIITEMGECCPTYKLSSVTRNGQTICLDNCSEIIVVEL